MNRPTAAWTVLRICIGAFFVFEGLSKIAWFTDTSVLAARLAEWSHAAAPGSISALYLERVAAPFTSIWARMVPLGEIGCGTAMILGVGTPVFAFLAFLMALNFHVASGTLFKYSFLTNGYGLPVLGSTLALTLAGGTKPRQMKLRPERA